ncbi:Protein of unknown function [Tenacibaculum sp. MAR_2009_124]|uniref:DUF4199 domain-containing protein n=1 Tax=Tenacibaculum sp. MAR_2009_124 TaxID=1250059 RepID=UPI00089D4402|nr:DUF4199 domain-containing protein [Tenacibaculum sp. MAR_2009_124]SEB42815.1 Protein of unknown function [Tenacibaculum sp. MAR_2009_124]
MEKQANSKSIILNYGLYTGGISILLALVLYAIGKAADPGIALSIIGSVVPLTLLVLGIRKFKTENNGYISWGQAVKIGVGIALIWGVLALGFQYILENVIAPELIEQKLEVARTTMENWGISEDVIEENLESQKNQSPFLGIAMGLLFFAFMGFVVSAIAGAIMKKTEEIEY